MHSQLALLMLGKTQEATMSARILIAEDDEMQAAALRTVLACRGYEAESVTDGLEAVRRLRGGHYNMALLDFRMPEISGLAAARLLHDLLPPADCPRLIAVTAAADELQEIEKLAEYSSFHAIVSKQSGLQALLDAVEANAAEVKTDGHMTQRMDVWREPSTERPILIDTAERVMPAAMARYPFRDAHYHPSQIQSVSLAAFKLTLGSAWERISYRAMMRAEQIIRRRLGPKDLVSRISDHGFAIWFDNANEIHIEAVLGGAVREIRLRFLNDYGDDVPPNPDFLI
jgi:CheY-like chemotaxis protein